MLQRSTGPTLKLRTPLNPQTLEHPNLNPPLGSSSTASRHKSLENPLKESIDPSNIALFSSRLRIDAQKLGGELQDFLNYPGTQLRLHISSK
jgi:hypothetical protein